MPYMPISFKGEPGFIGPQGEPGLPGLPGTKVSRPLFPSFFSEICAIPAGKKSGRPLSLSGWPYISALEPRQPDPPINGRQLEVISRKL